MRRGFLLAGCAGLAVLWNLHPLTLFFDIQILLGGSLAVFALLVWGWPALLVGVAASLATVQLWGHPVGLVNGVLQLVWLQLFLSRFNGRAGRRDNGRVVLASLGYWLLVGGPVEAGWFRVGMGLTTTFAAGLALKEMVNGVLCAVLGLGLYLALGFWNGRHRRGTVSIRGLAFALVLSAILLPALVLTQLHSNQLRLLALECEKESLEDLGRLASLVSPEQLSGVLANAGHPGSAVQIHSGDDRVISSDPALFARLAAGYRPEQGTRLPLQDLQLLMAIEPGSVLRDTLDGYWRVWLPGPPAVEVVRPAAPLVERMDADELLGSFGSLVVLMLLGALISDGLADALERQFLLVLGSSADLAHAGSADPPAPQPLGSQRLDGSPLRELDALATAINARNSALRQGRDQLLRALDNLPIPMACQLLDQGDGGVEAGTWDGPVILLNRQFQATFGYSTDQITSVHAWAALAYPDATARERWLRRWRHAVAAARGHEGEIRSLEETVVCGDGHRADVRIDAVASGNLLIVSLLDLTERNRAERHLRAMVEREKRQDEWQRQQLQQRLRSSLSAAAVVHEIKQPLSTILLNCRLALQTLDQHESAAGPPPQLRQTLTELTVNADRVVETMERMRMLLRNVETQHTPVDLAATVDSSLLFLKRELRQRQVQLSTAGLDQVCMVLGDSAQLQIAITNVIRNAIEAMAQLDPPAARRLAVSLVRDGQEVTVVVADSGPGFTADAIDLPLSSSKPEGTGIGLFVVRTTLDHHQGSLSIGRSEALGGAEVCLRLPLLSSGSEAESANGAAGRAGNVG